MVAIPANTVDNPIAELAKWYKLKKRIAEECDPLIAQERILRARLFAHFFPTPVEGTGNKYTLPDGFVVNGKYPIDRSVDPAVVATLRTMTLSGLEPGFRQSLNLHGAPDAMPLLEAVRLNLDTVLRWKPELVVKEYKKLTAEQTAIVDRCLTVKPGSIALEVKPPAAAKATEAAGFGPTDIAPDQENPT